MMQPQAGGSTLAPVSGMLIIENVDRQDSTGSGCFSQGRIIAPPEVLAKPAERQISGHVIMLTDNIGSDTEHHML
ncbi:MAG: hypothetical protein P8X39_01825 [Desulfofustis sp.]